MSIPGRNSGHSQRVSGRSQEMQLGKIRIASRYLLSAGSLAPILILRPREPNQ
jgi:hypothetical protein